MSDEEDFTESEGEDFSASEDEWVPDTKKKASTTSSSDDPDDEIQTSSSSRRKVFQQRKPAAKTAPKSAPKIKPERKVDHDDDDSDSSGDDCLVDPKQMDFNSDFFATTTSNKPAAVQTKSELLVAVKSDSDDDGDDFVDPECFQRNEQFISNLERAKAQLIHSKESNQPLRKSQPSAAVDISQLLKMGESKPSTSAAAAAASAPRPNASGSKKSKPQPTPANNSDSDWEEVADQKTMRSDEVVTISVGPQLKPKPNRTQLELEAQIKRALNRRKKETQLLMHKTHVLCWIGHGNYVNAVLNDPNLMQMCLQFMPSKFTYPKETTDRAYFEQIAKWYTTQMQLKGKRSEAKLARLPALPVSLALQIRSKVAISKKAFVLIFIVLLRAIGVQCRLVLNLATMPLRPPNKELCSISMKTETAAKSEAKPKTMKAKSSLAQPDLSVLKSSPDKSQGMVRPKDSPDAKRIESKKSASTKSHTKQSTSKNIVSPHFAEKKSTPPTASSKVTVSKSPQVSQIKDTAQKTTSTKTTSNKSRTNQSATIVSPHFAETKSTVIASKSSPASRSSKTTALKKPTVLPHISAQTSAPQPSASTSHNTAKKRPHNSKTAEPVPSQTLHQSSHFTKNTTGNLPFGSPVSKRTRSHPKRVVDMPHLPQLDGADDVRTTTRKRAAKKPSAAVANSADSSDADEDSDFVAVAPKRKPTASAKPKASKAKSAVNRVKADAKRCDRRLLSTDDEADNRPSKLHMNVWLEVFVEASEQWMCMDLFKLKVSDIDTIRSSATKPLAYVLAWNNDSTIRDVSARYCTNWNTTTRLLRVAPDWLSKALNPYRPTPTFRTRTEDLELDKIHVKEPLPKAIGDFKNHPLYALQRHLLKFEGIYPPDAPTFGFIRNEPVYSRDCVHTLHSRDIWLKSALVVRPGETAYKVVKARPKWDRQTNRMLEPQPLEIFGHWQTQAYDPPTAENGIVPRNAYGNVELFKPEMLPKKCVHLQLPALNRTCKKLKIDCAQAVTGFDFHSGSCHPTFDGFVVCEEFAEQVVEQYWLDQEEAQLKENEKYEARVYGNWKKLIRGLMIRERLQKKYKFADTSSKDGGGTSDTTKSRRK